MKCVGVICAGAAIAASRDLSFDAAAYTYVALTNGFASLYSVYINVAAKRTRLDVWGLLYVNSLVTVPWLGALTLALGDMQCLADFPDLTTPSFQLAFQASILLAFCLNVATFFTTTLNSALTKTVTGGLKVSTARLFSMRPTFAQHETTTAATSPTRPQNFVSMLLGASLFGDYRWHPVNAAGMVICFAGGVAYSVVAWSESAAGKARDRPRKELSDGNTADIGGKQTEHIAAAQQRDVPSGRVAAVELPLVVGVAVTPRAAWHTSLSESSSAPSDLPSVSTSAHSQVDTSRIQLLLQSAAAAASSRAGAVSPMPPSSVTVVSSGHTSTEEGGSASGCDDDASAPSPPPEAIASPTIVPVHWHSPHAVPRTTLPARSDGAWASATGRRVNRPAVPVVRL